MFTLDLHSRLILSVHGKGLALCTSTEIAKKMSEWGHLLILH